MKYTSLALLLGGLTAGTVFGVSCQKSEPVAPLANLPAIEGFNAKAGGEISLSQGRDWVAAYRKGANDKQPSSLAYYLGDQAIKQALDQPGCVGIRFYNATEPDGEQTLVLVGVDANGHDILPRQDQQGKTIYADGKLIDSSAKCPTVCDETTPLTQTPEMP
jgi:poly(3-hydroxybutyrate) depolymerase